MAATCPANKMTEIPENETEGSKTRMWKMRASWLFTYLCFYGGTTRFKRTLKAIEKPVSERHVEQEG